MLPMPHATMADLVNEDQAEGDQATLELQWVTLYCARTG